MEKITSLEDVNASALPAKILILLSKYAKVLRQTNGIIIKLSSLRVFLHVHKTCLMAQNEELNGYYNEMLEEVNKHIEAGTMFTNEQKRSKTPVSFDHKNAEAVNNNYASVAGIAKG